MNLNTPVSDQPLRILLPALRVYATDFPVEHGFTA
jgi:hypothetical protein